MSSNSISTVTSVGPRKLTMFDYQPVRFATPLGHQKSNREGTLPIERRQPAEFRRPDGFSKFSIHWSGVTGAATLLSISNVNQASLPFSMV